MTSLHPIQLLSFETCKFGDRAKVTGFRKTLREFACNDVNLAICLDGGIIKIRMDGDTKVCRQCPRCRRPDDNKHILPCKGRIDLGRIRQHWKLYIYGRRRVVVILDLGLGERRLVMNAPIDGTQSFGNPAAFEELAKKPSGRRFVFR